MKKKESPFLSLNKVSNCSEEEKAMTNICRN
jgi:hypothetical protein